MKTKPIKSNKYVGVYYYPLSNGDKSYSITYKTLEGKKPWIKIGLYSDGIREVYCHKKRSEYINNMKHGETTVIVKNRRTAKEVMTFGMIYDNYIEYKDGKIADRSLKDIKSKYKNHIKPTLEQRDIDSITKKDIENMVSKKENQLAPKTLNMITELVGTIFKYEIDEGTFKQENPAKKAHKYSVNNERKRFLSKEEIQLLLKNAKNEDVITYIFTVLAVTTGGRLNTICNIQKKDIDIKTQIVSLQDFKNDETYNGFIKKEFIGLLDKHIHLMKPNDFILGNGDVSKKIQRRLSPILNRLFNDGLKEDDRQNRVVVHSLRHTFASQLIANNVPIFVVQKLMNHADIKMTMRYVNVDSYFGKGFVDDMF